ncbi:MAG: 30S ribosomal protein S5 [Candidatus Nanoarchaeia archaeon]
MVETNKETREQQEETWEDEWIPKTQLGKEVKAGKIKNIEEIFGATRKILEPEIVDKLLDIKTDLLLIGQAKGKFGGGKRRAWKQTQKKTEVGNIPKFSVLAVAGDEHGYVGIGRGEAKETFPAREKGIRKAKLNLIRIKRGCGSFDCSCHEEHSIPFSVEGKCSSVRVKLMPASQGTGLVASDELKRILRLAGIKDVYSKTYGKTKSTINLAKACMDALNKLSKIK